MNPLRDRMGCGKMDLFGSPPDPVALFQIQLCDLPRSEQAVLLAEWLAALTHGDVIGHWGTNPLVELRQVERVVFYMVVEAAKAGFIIPSHPKAEIDPMGFVAVFYEFFRKVAPFLEIEILPKVEMAKARMVGRH